MPNALKTNNTKKNSIQIDIKLTPIITNTFANRFFFLCNTIPVINEGIPNTIAVTGKYAIPI